MMGRIREQVQARLVLPVALAAFLLPFTTWAQQGSSSSQSEQANQRYSAKEADDKVPDESSSVKSTTSAAPEEPQIRQIGKAAGLNQNRGPLRWGSLYVASAEFFQVYGQFHSFDRANDEIRRTSLFRTNIVYDHRFRRSRFALQYEPRLAIVNGRTLGNPSNQYANFDTYYLLSPRWTMTFADRFIYVSNRHVIGEDYLQSDGLTGSTLQTNFLDNASTWVANVFGLNLAYLLSPRTRFVLSPNFTYAYTNDPITSTHGREYGTGLSLSHSLSVSKSVGFSYSVQRIDVSTAATARIYQALGGSYTQRLSPTWWINASLGAATDRGSAARRWTVYSNVSLLKSFRRSSITLAYTRDHSFAGYVTSNYADRGDVRYRIALTRRLQTSFGVGYYREVATPGGVTGKYALLNASYRILPSVSLFASYARKWQTGDARQLLIGTRDFFTAGIRWAPPIVAR